MTISTSTGLIGVSTDRNTTIQEFPLGTVVAALGNSYTYAQATAASIAAAGTVALNGTFGTTAGSTYTHDCTTTVPQNSYFWAKKVASPF